MAAPKVISVTSLAEFATHLEELLRASRARTPAAGTKVTNWYRGHSATKTFRLEPGLYRHDTVKGIDGLIDLETSMMDEFKRQSLLHSYQPPSDGTSDSIAMLFYMQHHGVPTRLLDWTSNPFIALYFALSGARKDKKKKVYAESASVWVLDPFQWNRHAMAELKWLDQGPGTPHHDDVQSWLPKRPQKNEKRTPMYPDAIAIVGAANTQRMLAQRGHFTLFGESRDPMEVAYDKRKFPEDSLVRLEVPPASIDDVLSVLIAVGYTDSVAYPDLQGLAMEIRRIHGFNA